MNVFRISGAHPQKSGTTVSGTADLVHCVLASVLCIKGTTSKNGRGINISGVDFWHAVEFSRNGRFLQDPFTGLSGRFVLRYEAYQTVSGPISRRPAPFPARSDE